ncbi:hypothetical protein VRU48_05375 [Pedobacter sp. KR3-3]|uniref:DUF4369 domain-containing protein n=1 Tax=Pedobacter albus TaxID=3113905 RepID=A0ABU7I5J0_9SPHI|nr:hypothetical protein [Pedobacter sp. KR3-3]MEE1944529.1 hypothetical protein [Pedobacter sp. KR3-3]
MKPFLMAFALLLSIGYAKAQSSLPGYYITPNNDTVKAQIKVKKGMFGQKTNDFNEEVEVADEAKGIIKFLPADIHGYGFFADGKKYVFVSKPIKDGTKKFLSPVYIGPQSSLYLYGIQTTGSTFSSKQVFYTFEKPDNAYLFLRNTLNNKFRSDLKEFYKDNTAALQVIDARFKYWLDLDKDLLALMIKANAQ